MDINEKTLPTVNRATPKTKHNFCDLSNKSLNMALVIILYLITYFVIIEIFVV